MTRPHQSRGWWLRICDFAPSVAGATWTVNKTGARFAVYPEIDDGYCCVCCEDKNGCGFVPRGCIARAAGVYLGVQEHNGHQCDVWDAMGGQDNLYYQDRASGLPVALDMVFGKTHGKGVHRNFLNASTGPISSDVFQPPQYWRRSASASAYCPGTTCDVLRRPRN